MMRNIEALPTEAYGWTMRSRLEARWAIFLTEIGMEWDYERVTFHLDSGRHYTPDFRVRHAPIWHGEFRDVTLFLEVKPHPDIAQLEVPSFSRPEVWVQVVFGIPFSPEGHSSYFISPFRAATSGFWWNLEKIDNDMSRAAWLATHTHFEPDGHWKLPATPSSSNLLQWILKEAS